MRTQHNGQEAPSSGSEPDVLDCYLADLSAFALLTHEEECTLARRVREGDREARERFIQSNLRLVVHFAKSYPGYGVTLEDLVQEGNIGLMRAVDRFDSDRGIHFATYAAWWIKQAILRALDNQARTIRLPSYVLARLRHLSRDGQTWDEQSSLEPRVLSLDVLRGRDEDCELLEVLAGDEQEPTLADLCEQETRAECAPHLGAMLTTLTPREWQVITLHFGLGGTTEPLTYREIGKPLGITKERVRQILESALSKLRQSEQARELAAIWHEQAAC